MRVTQRPIKSLVLCATPSQRPPVIVNAGDAVFFDYFPVSASTASLPAAAKSAATPRYVPRLRPFAASPLQLPHGGDGFTQTKEGSACWCGGDTHSCRCALCICENARLACQQRLASSCAPCSVRHEACRFQEAHNIIQHRQRRPETSTYSAALLVLRCCTHHTVWLSCPCCRLGRCLT